MRQSINLLTMLAFMITLTACNKDHNNIQGEDQELLQVNTLEEISGSNMEGEFLVTYSATIDDKDMVHLTTDINGKMLEAFVSYERFTVRYDGHDNSLTRDEKQALGETSNKIARALYPVVEDGAEIKVNAVQNTVVTVLSHWSEAPVNLPISTKGEIGGLEKGPTDDGITCIRKGRFYNISFDDDRIVNQSPGDITTLRKIVSTDDPCRGRCGPGCRPWWVASAWTLDCFEHDWCVAYYDTGILGGNHECGDHFYEATDDWVFGWLGGCWG